MSNKIGKSICVIPDVQAKPGVDISHLTWIGNYLAEKRPDNIVCIGDFNDIPSLSSYDIGKAEAEGKRYSEDIKFGKHAMGELLAPIKEHKQHSRYMYNPKKDFTI